MGATGFTRFDRATAAAVALVILGSCANVSFNEPQPNLPPTRARTVVVEPAPPPPRAQTREARHRTFVSEGIPVEYVSRTNPWPPTQEEIDSGGRLYSANCLRCHGVYGRGDGEAGRDLTLPPAVLSAMVDQPYSVDQYLLWSISEGGMGSASVMPAFKSQLTDREIWQIVNYMRAGFPPVAAGAG